jgi:hypothetical protein
MGRISLKIDRIQTESIPDMSIFFSDYLSARRKSVVIGAARGLFVSVATAFRFVASTVPKQWSEMFKNSMGRSGAKWKLIPFQSQSVMQFVPR